MPDYDNPVVEAQWNAERRDEVLSYLDSEGIPDNHIGFDPAWSLAPYVSIWAISSSANPDAIAGWAISGDLPTDYVASTKARTPREAANAIASLWAEAAQFMIRGERHPTFSIGSGEREEELAPLLTSRAALLLEWVEDPEIWES